MVATVALVMALGIQAQAAGEVEDAPSASLRGSPASMVQQHNVALEHGLSFYQTEEEIRNAAAEGELVQLPGDENYEVADFVDLPYVHPAARTFVERTAALYREACGEQLVVTSGVRAIANQPPNAHALSVHPAGMAVDLRVSPVEECRQWLENKLLALEQQGVLNGIREFRPPHYHVAIFPEPYIAYVEAQRAAEAAETEPAAPEETAESRLWGLLAVLLLLGAAAGAWIIWRARKRNGSGGAAPPGLEEEE